MHDAGEKLRAALTRPARPSSDYDLNPNIKLPAGRVLRPAAVLVPIWLHPDGARLILTKRSSHLKHHPGQIALPGGKVDEGDATPAATALREAWEEIGLPAGAVEIIGTLADHETVTSFQVTPVVGLVRGDLTFRPEMGEVDEVFTVPLTHILNPARFSIERRQWRGEWRQFYIVPWGPYYIWGATARILRGLADRMAG